MITPPTLDWSAAHLHTISSSNFTTPNCLFRYTVPAPIPSNLVVLNLYFDQQFTSALKYANQRNGRRTVMYNLVSGPLH